MASCTEVIMPLRRTVRAHAAPRRVYRSLADGITMPAERFFLYASARPRGCSCMCGRRRRHSEVGDSQDTAAGAMSRKSELPFASNKAMPMQLSSSTHEQKKVF